MAQNKTLNARISWKRDTSANWTSQDPVLLNGEIIIVDTASGETRFKIGDGTKKYSQLPFEDEAIRNLIGEKAKVSIETWADATSSVSIPLDELVINKVANSTVYQAMKDAGKIDDNELYLVEGDGMEIVPSLTSGTKIADIMVDGVATASLYAPSLSAYAKLASPTFTGTPKAPTAAAGNNSTQIATTAYADRAATNAANSLKTSLTSGTTTIIVKEAEHATSADSATTATTASGLDATGIAQVKGTKVDSATKADSATTANSATMATTASGLDSTGVAQVKGIKVDAATAADTATTATTANKTTGTLTVGSKTFNGSTNVSIVLSDLGLEQAMRFKGSVTTLPTSNNTAGDVVLYNGFEYVWTGTEWEQLGQEGSFSLKTHTHQVTHKPEGTVSKPTFTGTQATINSSYTPSGTVSKPTFTGTKFTHGHEFVGDEATITVNFTPEGTVSKPTFTGSAVNTGAATTTSDHTASIKPVASVGTLPSASLSAGTAPSATFSAGSLTKTVSTSGPNRRMTLTYTAPSHSFNTGTYPTLTFNAGTLPTLGNAVTVSTSSHKHSVTAAGSVSQPIFTGTADSASSTYVFTGTIEDVEITPAGTISQPTFTGTAGTATATYTPTGSVSQPTFTGTSATITTTQANA